MFLLSSTNWECARCQQLWPFSSPLPEYIANAVRGEERRPHGVDEFFTTHTEFITLTSSLFVPYMFFSFLLGGVERLSWPHSDRATQTA